MVSDEKSIDLTEDFMFMINCFFLPVFKIHFLSLAINSLVWYLIFLGVDVFKFILLEVH